MTKRKLLFGLVAAAVVVSIGWAVVREVRLQSYTTAVIAGRDASVNAWQLVGNQTTGTMWYSDGNRWIDTQLPLEHSLATELNFNNINTPSRIAFNIAQITTNHPPGFSASTTIKHLTTTISRTGGTEDLVQFAEELTAGDIKIAYRSSLDNGVTWTNWVDPLSGATVDSIVVLDENDAIVSTHSIGTTQTSRNNAITAAISSVNGTAGNQLIMPAVGQVFQTDAAAFTADRLKISLSDNTITQLNTTALSLLRIEGDNITLRDATVENTQDGTGGGAGIIIAGDYAVVSGIECHQAGGNDGGSNPFAIVEGSGVIGTVVEDCNFSRLHGGVFFNGETWTIRDCTFRSIHGHAISCNSSTPGGSVTISDVSITFDLNELAFLDGQNPSNPGTIGGINFNVMFGGTFGVRWGKIFMDDVSYTFVGNHSFSVNQAAMKFQGSEYISLNNVRIENGVSTTNSDLIVNFDTLNDNEFSDYTSDYISMTNCSFECPVKWQGSTLNYEANRVVFKNCVFHGSATVNNPNHVQFGYGVRHLTVDGCTVDGNEVAATSGAIRATRCDEAVFRNNLNKLTTGPFFLPGSGTKLDINNVVMEGYQNPNGAPFTSQSTEANTLLLAKRPGVSNEYTMSGSVLTAMPTNSFWDFSSGARAISDDVATLSDHQYDGTAWQPILSGGGSSYTIPVVVHNAPVLITGTGVAASTTDDIATAAQFTDGVTNASAQWTSNEDPPGSGIRDASYHILLAGTGIAPKGETGAVTVMFLDSCRFTDAGIPSGKVTIDFYDPQGQYIVGYDFTHLIEGTTDKDVYLPIRHNRTIQSFVIRQFLDGADHSQLRIAGFSFPALTREALEIRDNTNAVVGYKALNATTDLYENYTVPGGEIVTVKEFGIETLVQPIIMVSTLAEQPEPLAYAGGTVMHVTDDTTASNNGVYMVTGVAPGGFNLTQSWTKN